MKIAIEGATRLDGSYGIVNVNLAAALARLGAQATLCPWDQGEDTCQAELEQAWPGSRLQVCTDGPAFDLRIRQIWPPVWARPTDGARLVVVQPWEFGTIPLAWLEGANGADAIWVPSSYVKAEYVQSGVPPDKIWVVPNGSELVGHPAPRPERPRQAPLKLLFVGGGIPRKGVDVLIAALEKLPPAVLDRVWLTIKESGFGSYYKGQSLVDSSLQAAPRAARVTQVVREHLSRPDLVKLMTESDLLVHPYRAEGFGLPILEAMALGLPVLMTKGGAADDFCGDEEALTIPADLTVATSPFVGDLMTVGYPYYLGPHADELASAISALATGAADPGAKRDAAIERSRSYSWERVAEVALSALDDLMAHRPARDTFTETADLVRRFVRDPDARSAKDLSARLALLGDHASAGKALQLAAARDPGDLSLKMELSRWRAAWASRPDLWSASPWRLDLAAACREDGDVPAVVHLHEGDEAATLRIAATIAPYFSHCRSVLDLGCGQGSMLRTLRAAGKAVLGVEGDPELVQSLRAEGFDVRQGWAPGDLAGLDIPNVDGVFLGHIIEHLHPKEALEVLKWVAGKLNDNGVVVVQTPDFNVDFVSKTNFWLDPTHVRPYPLSLLKGLLESAGFSPLEGGCRPLGPQAPLDILAVGKLRRLPAVAPPRAPCKPARQRLAHIGLFGSQCGMGRAARGLLDLAELASAGIDVVRVDLAGTASATAAPGGGAGIEAVPDVPTFGVQDMAEITADVAVADVPVGWLPEILPRVKAAHRVVRFAFEASPLPRYLVDAMSGVDEIWAMSTYAADVAVASGLRAEAVHVVPACLPADWEVAPAGSQPSPARGTRKATAFSSIFNFEPRKNPGALVRAFAVLLERSPGLRLFLKVSGTDDASFWSWARAAVGEAGFARLRAATDLFTQELRDDQIRTLLAASDVFVLPTRGEGFGLPFLEAMSLGVPAVCPDIGGHRDFCDATTSYLVPTTSVPCLAQAGLALFRESRWHEVDFEALVAAMDLAAADPGLRASKAEASLARAAGFTAERTAQASSRRLSEIFCRPELGSRQLAGVH